MECVTCGQEIPEGEEYQEECADCAGCPECGQWIENCECEG